MDDLKQWLKKILIIVGVLLAIQIVALVAMKVVPLLPFAEGCQGAGFACPKGQGIDFDEVKYLDSIEDVETYYGWDYMIGGCGWVSVLNQAMGCEFAELNSNEVIPAGRYNYFSWGDEMQTGRDGMKVPLIRFSFGNTYGELVLPCSGYSCEYGNVGCSGCYSWGIQSWLDGCGE